jgi:hypothetical protein
MRLHLAPLAAAPFRNYRDPDLRVAEACTLLVAGDGGCVCLCGGGTEVTRDEARGTRSESQ